MLNADALIGQTGELLSHNVFAYCVNDPVNNYDPSGFRHMEVENGGGISSSYVQPISTYSGNSAGNNYLNNINNSSNFDKSNVSNSIKDYYDSQIIAGVDTAITRYKDIGVSTSVIGKFGGAASFTATMYDVGKNYYNTINGQYSWLEGVGRSAIDVGFTLTTAAFAAFAIISLPATAIGVTVGIFVTGAIGYGMGCVKDALKEGIYEENNANIKLDNNRLGTSYGWYIN